jgi:hypothetical protein
VFLCKIDFTQNRYHVKSNLREKIYVRNSYSISRLKNVQLQIYTKFRLYSNLYDFDYVKSNIQLIYGINSHIITNHHANLCPYPILPTAKPTTAHIRYYMISDHVESNILTLLCHQQPHQPECQPLPISDFTNCNANHCPYSILHDFGPCRIEYGQWSALQLVKLDMGRGWHSGWCGC